MTTTIKKSYATYALIVLTLLNLLNYVDRFIFAPLIPYIKADTGYTDAQLGYIASAFTIIYTVCSPLFGYLRSVSARQINCDWNCDLEHSDGGCGVLDEFLADAFFTFCGWNRRS